MVASLVHLVLVGLAAIATAAEKIDTSTLDVVGDDWFAQVFTFRSIGGAFLFLLPLTIGIFTAVVPPQVGAPNIAFPRPASAAASAYLVGSGLIVVAYALDGGPYGRAVTGSRTLVVDFLLLLLPPLVPLNLPH